MRSFTCVTASSTVNAGFCRSMPCTTVVIGLMKSDSPAGALRT